MKKKPCPLPTYSRGAQYHSYAGNPALFITDDFGNSYRLPHGSQSLDQWAWRLVQDMAWRSFGNCY